MAREGRVCLVPTTTALDGAGTTAQRDHKLMGRSAPEQLATTSRTGPAATLWRVWNAEER